MKISLIVAASENHIIGKDNALPWRLPADLKYFKAVTMGKPIVMGRKTWESLGKPLPGRTNIIVTRQPLQWPGCVVVDSAAAAVRAVDDADELMVIGGAEIFREFLPVAQRIYLTRVHALVHGDVVFPPPDPAQWREVSRQDYPADERHAHPYSFIVLERV